MLTILIDKLSYIFLLLLITIVQRLAFFIIHIHNFIRLYLSIRIACL